MNDDLSLSTFRTVPDDQKAAERIAEHMVEQDRTKAILFYNSDSTYSKSLAREFENSLKAGGGTVEEKIDLLETNFNAAQKVETLKEQYAAEDTALVLLPSSGKLTSAIQVMRENDGEFLMLGGDDLYSFDVLEEGGKAALGLVIAVPWHINRKRDSDFVQESLKIWRADVNWRTATAYDAVMALSEGLRNRQASTREGLAAALSSQDFVAKGATEDVCFQADSDSLDQRGNRNQESDLVKVQRGPRSKTGYDFEPVSSADKQNMESADAQKSCEIDGFN